MIRVVITKRGAMLPEIDQTIDGRRLLLDEPSGVKLGLVAKAEDWANVLARVEGFLYGYGPRFQAEHGERNAARAAAKAIRRALREYARPTVTEPPPEESFRPQTDHDIATNRDRDFQEGADDQ